MNAPHPIEDIRSVGPRRFVANALYGCLGLALGAWLLHTFGGSLRTSVTLDRARVARQSDTCDVLVVGPSYVMGQFDEPVFDAEARRQGFGRLRSCKFGGTGFRGHEVRVHLEQLLRDSEWPRLSLVVVDVTLGASPRFDDANWFHPRLIHLHTWSSLPWFVEHYRRNPDELTPMRAAARLAHFAANYLNLGAGIDTLPVLQLSRHAAATLGMAVTVPRDPVDAYIRDRKRRWRKKQAATGKYLEKTSPEKHRHAIDELIAKKRDDTEKLVSADTVLPLRALARTRGAEAVFINAPVWRARASAIEQPDPTDPLFFYDFNDPVAYPELYEPANRGRNHHLSWAGGQVYSALLARTVLQHRRAR